MTRRSPVSEAADLLAELVSRGVRTICFMRSRRGIELINRFASDELGRRGQGELAERIAPYRAGYTPQQRREIEAQLASGELLAVVATDALELGIDVGELDAAICVTFPGTVASLRQMWGRAGRRRRGLAVYVAGEDALDQFFCRHPDEFLERPVEAAILDHRSEQIQMQHLLAAAYEAPLGPRRRRDPRRGLAGARRAAGDRRASCGAAAGERYLTRTRRLRRRADRPALGLGRQRRGRRRDLGRDARQRRGRARLLDRPPRRDLPAPRALLRGRASSTSARAGRSSGRFEGDYYTQPKKETEIYIEGIETQRGALGVELNFGDGLGHRAGDRLPAQAPRRPQGDRHRRARPARAELRHPGALVRARQIGWRRRCRARCCSAPCTPPSTGRSRCCR